MTDASIALGALPVTRAQAKAENSFLYFTGKACVSGHLSPRYVSNGQCLQCQKDRQSTPEYKAYGAAKMKRYRDADPEKYKALRTEHLKQKPELSRAKCLRYRVKNRGKLRQIAIEYYNANRAAILEKQRIARHADPTENRARVRAWVKANPDRAKALFAQYRARKRGAVGRYTAAEIAQLNEWQNGNCAACQRDLRETGYHVDHIVPLASGGTNWQNNLQLLCPRCNSSKRARDYAEWIEEQRAAGIIP